jgi:hypothetical protein
MCYNIIGNIIKNIIILDEFGFTIKSVYQKFWSSICIPMLLFHSNRNDVYTRFFSVSLAFVEPLCCKSIKMQSKVALGIYPENTNSVSVDDQDNYKHKFILVQLPEPTYTLLINKKYQKNVQKKHLKQDSRTSQKSVRNE